MSEPIRDFLGRPAPEALQPLLRVLDCTDMMELAGMHGEARERGDEELKSAINSRMGDLMRFNAGNKPPQVGLD